MTCTAAVTYELLLLQVLVLTLLLLLLLFLLLHPRRQPVERPHQEYRRNPNFDIDARHVDRNAQQNTHMTYRRRIECGCHIQHSRACRSWPRSGNSRMERLELGLFLVPQHCQSCNLRFSRKNPAQKCFD